jgi:hypothetical protein
MDDRGNSGLANPWPYLAIVLACAPAAGAMAHWLPTALGATTPPLVFAATHWLVPAVRPVRRPLVSPQSILYAGFAIQLVVAPLLFIVDGPVRWVFPVGQTREGIAFAALLIGLSFPCWAVGLVLVQRRSAATAATVGWGSVPRWVIVLFAVLGTAGLALWALRADEWEVTADAGADGVVTVVRLLLRPFLAVAGIAILSNVLLARGASLAGRRKLVLLGGCVVLVVLSSLTLDARRAPLLAALLALLAAYGLITNRPSIRALLMLGVGATAAFLAVRVLRSPDQPFNLLFNRTGADEGLLSAFNTEVQSYAGGLQMVAFLLDHVGRLGDPLYGRGQLYTAIAPLPRLGESVRDETPGALYNSLFIDRQDQVLPLAGQLYLDFGVLSVCAGFILLGLLTGVLQRMFARSQTLVEAFVWALPAPWLAFSLGSSPIGFYQFLIYFSLPAYVLLALAALRVRSRRRAAAPP